MIVLAELVAAGLAFLPQPGDHLPAYLFLFGSGSLIALAAAQSLSASRPLFLLGLAVLLRATLLLGSSSLSDDVRRYAWDARVAAAGISPWAFAPSAPELAPLASRLPAAVPHADVRTVYPPVAQAAFRAGLGIGGELGIRTVFAAADVAVVAAILALGGPGAGGAAALYAFHPLAIVSSAGEGHLDSLGVALLLAALALSSRGRRASGGAAFGLSVLTKYVPLAAALPLVRRGRLAFAAAAVGTAALLWIDAMRGGASPLGGMADYATRWEFNSVAYPALTAALERTDAAGAAKELFTDLKARLGHPAWAQAVYPYFYAGFLARALLGVALLAVLVAIARRVEDPERAVFLSIAALLLASPTLHPWYLLWILPFAARRREPAFLWLSFAAVFSAALLHPVPGLSRGAVLLAEYAPCAALLVFPRRRARTA